MKRIGRFLISDRNRKQIPFVLKGMTVYKAEYCMVRQCILYEAESPLFDLMTNEAPMYDLDFQYKDTVLDNDIIRDIIGFKFTLRACLEQEIEAASAMLNEINIPSMKETRNLLGKVKLLCSEYTKATEK